MILRSLVLRVLSTTRRKMSVFTNCLNPITGKEEWEIQDENYDFHQEIARSAFADMLHDSERNKKYYIGIRRAVEKMHKLGKRANVLDIGTGTGLLSMMAVKCGADSVVACEAFQPMADCAVKIIAENGFSGKIEVIRKRSTELKVGENGDMKRRANILVTEVFDTELIGEGAISTFNHAHQELLESDCIVVPTSSTMYAQVVSSRLARRWNKLEPIEFEGRVVLESPESVNCCPGSAAVHDIQLSQLDEADFETIISPTPVFTFDWSGRGLLPCNDSSTSLLRADRDGVAQVVFVWWDIVMDTENETVLSCAPVWAHPDKDRSGKIPWRDHWMQGVYFLPHEVAVERGQEVALIGCHDEYSLWFSLKTDLTLTPADRLSPICSCGLHVAMSRTRFGAMNDSSRHDSYLAVVRDLVKSDSAAVCLGNCTLLGLAAAQLGAEHVYCMDDNFASKRLISAYLESNPGLSGRITEIRGAEEIKHEISLVLGEPHFTAALLPWQNVSFWYLKQELQAVLPQNRIKDVVPAKAVVWAMPVQFDDLWKIRSPLESVEGFTMSLFDELIDKSSDISDSPVEAQPLWEYPCVPLGEPFQAFHFDFSKDTEAEMATGLAGTVALRHGLCHGVVLWVGWDLNGRGTHIVTTGPLRTPTHAHKVSWDIHTRQGVHFLKHGRQVNELNSLRFATEFDRGDVKFSFKIE